MWQGLYLSKGDREDTINVGSAPDIFFSVKLDTSSPLFSPLSHGFKQVLCVWQIALPMSIKNTWHSDLWIKGTGFFLTRMQPVAGVMQLETAPYLRNGTHARTRTCAHTRRVFWIKSVWGFKGVSSYLGFEWPGAAGMTLLVLHEGVY